LANYPNNSLADTFLRYRRSSSKRVHGQSLNESIKQTIAKFSVLIMSNPVSTYQQHSSWYISSTVRKIKLFPKRVYILFYCNI